jgi:hypothetical protein
MQKRVEGVGWNQDIWSLLETICRNLRGVGAIGEKTCLKQLNHDFAGVDFACLAWLNSTFDRKHFIDKTHCFTKNNTHVPS